MIPLSLLVTVTVCVVLFVFLVWHACLWFQFTYIPLLVFYSSQHISHDGTSCVFWWVTIFLPWSVLYRSLWVRVLAHWTELVCYCRFRCMLVFWFQENRQGISVWRKGGHAERPAKFNSISIQVYCEKEFQRQNQSSLGVGATEGSWQRSSLCGQMVLYTRA